MNKIARDLLIDSDHFPYILIRDVLLPNILGEETAEILYWSGKKLARQFPLKDQEDVEGAFSHCGFGHLKLNKEEKNKKTYILSGETIATRLLNQDVSFNLEAGFLAEQLTQTLKLNCEVRPLVLTAKREVELVVTFD